MCNFCKGAYRSASSCKHLGLPILGKYVTGVSRTQQESTRMICHSLTGRRAPSQSAQGRDLGSKILLPRTFQVPPRTIGQAGIQIVVRLGCNFRMNTTLSFCSAHGPHTINDYKIAALGISGFLQSTPSSFESTSFAPWNLHGMVDGKRNSSREWAFDRIFFSLNGQSVLGTVGC